MSVCLQAFYYPPDAGMPMGGPGSSRFLRLEVHYHNPLLISGTYSTFATRILAFLLFYKHTPSTHSACSYIINKVFLGCCNLPYLSLCRPSGLFGDTVASQPESAAVRCRDHGAGPGLYSHHGYPTQTTHLLPQWILHLQVYTDCMYAENWENIPAGMPHIFPGFGP